MIRVLLAAAALLVLAAPGWAQADQDNPFLIRLKVHAAAAPKPALKYQLLPELREMHPGNPIFGYLKCFPEQNNFFHSKEASDEREKLLEMPLAELAKKKLGGYGGIALKRADAAARLQHPDWQTLQQLRTEGFYLLVPELQQMRTLTHALSARFRVEVAERRFDDAVVTAKTMFALARHTGEHPTLIGDLVGLAIASITIGNLDEMLQQPGCPNLYWALTALPRPFIDLRRGLQGERVAMDRETRTVVANAPMTAAQIKKVVDRLSSVVDGGKDPQAAHAWLAERVKDEAYVQAARQRLVEHGLTAERVKEFPAAQVLLLDEKFAFEVQRDDAMKVMLLPYWQVGKMLAARKQKDRHLFNRLLPSFMKVRYAQTRLEQRFALLRCVEALRLYAAEHGGKLPAKLADVPVPVPDDPFTSQPFSFQLDGDTAILRGGLPPGTAETLRVTYRVTVVK